MEPMEKLERTPVTLYDTQDQLKRHIYDRADLAFAAGDRDRDRIADRSRLLQRQREMKSVFLQALGGIPERTADLNAVVAGCVQGEGYRVEKVVYESLPGHAVTANLYLPDHADATASTAAVLFLCGHEYDGKHNAYYHRVMLRFVQAGLAVFAIDPPGQGERLGGLQDENGSVVWGTGEHQRLGIRCYPLGESVARYFVLDAMRAIDYLATREEIDPARIGVTGNSGGGTQTAMMMVCDDRVAAAAPGTFIMNRQSYMHAGGVQDAEQVWPGLTAAGFDHEDLLLIFAPKPLLVLAAEYDFFPIEGTKRTVERCRRFWEMCGKEASFGMFADRSPHRYTDRMAEEAAAFFVRHFFPGARPAAAPPLKPLDSSQLRCAPTERPDFDGFGSRSLQALIAERYSLLGPENGLDAKWLRERVFANRTPCSFQLRRLEMEETDGLKTEYWLWWSQTGIMNSGYLFGDGEGAGLTVAVWSGGTRQLSRHAPWIRRTCGEGRKVLALNVSGAGPHEPAPVFGRPVRGLFGMIHKLADELIWLGDSLAALRTYDLVRCVDLMEEQSLIRQGKVDLYAPGNAWLSAHLAAALDDRIGSVLSDAPHAGLQEWLLSAHEENEEWMSIVFPGLLHHAGSGSTRKGC